MSSESPLEEPKMVQLPRMLTVNTGVSVALLLTLLAAAWGAANWAATYRYDFQAAVQGMRADLKSLELRIIEVEKTIQETGDLTLRSGDLDSWIVRFDAEVELWSQKLEAQLLAQTGQAVTVPRFRAPDLYPRRER